MFAVQRIATNAPKLMSPVTQQVRTEYIIATKPRVRVSFAEKVAHGIFFSMVPLAIPIWCAVNFNKWSGSKAE